MPSFGNWVDPCPACPRKHRAIGGDGPQPSTVLCIAERPGENENRHGAILIGKAGQELDELYLPLGSLDRSSVRACNTVLCYADSNKTPTDKEVAQCAAHHLPREIECTKPEVILLLGATPCKLLPGVKLKMMHGIPQHTSKVGSLFGWDGWVIPMYHPAMGLHESRWMKSMMDDWRNIERSIAFNDFKCDPDPQPTNYKVMTRDHASYLQNRIWPHPFALDTENHGGRPWSTQISHWPGEGFLILAKDTYLLGWLNNYVQQLEVSMHHAAHDLAESDRMGVHIRKYRDTMQEAFHLGDLPHGLKELSYRLFRHTMTSYEETVRPASIRALQAWMNEALQIAILDLSFTERVQLKTKVKEVVRKGELESLLSRLIRNADPDSEYDPWGDDDDPRLNAFWRDPCNEWMVNHVEARIGRHPILGIGNCTMDEAVRYAVGDADYTGRCAVELARRREGAFKIYEGDRDA